MVDGTADLYGKVVFHHTRDRHASKLGRKAHLQFFIKDGTVCRSRDLCFVVSTESCLLAFSSPITCTSSEKLNYTQVLVPVASVQCNVSESSTLHQRWCHWNHYNVIQSGCACVRVWHRQPFGVRYGVVFSCLGYNMQLQPPKTATKAHQRQRRPWHSSSRYPILPNSHEYQVWRH
jgi:hypothetical protein